MVLFHQQAYQGKLTLMNHYIYAMLFMLPTFFTSKNFSFDADYSLVGLLTVSRWSLFAKLLTLQTVISSCLCKTQITLNMKGTI